MGVVIEICKKHPGGRTRMRVTEIAGTVATVSHGRRLGVYYINVVRLVAKAHITGLRLRYSSV